MRRIAVRALGIHRQGSRPDLGASPIRRRFRCPRKFLQDDVRAWTHRSPADGPARHADHDPACRYFAAEAAARLGDRSQSTLQHIRGSGCDPGAICRSERCHGHAWLPREEAIAWVREIWKDPHRLRLAALGACASATLRLAGVTIEWMETEDVARVAGQAFSMITGADLKYLDLDRDPPPHEPVEEEDELQVLDVDRDLPYPDADKVADWWRSNRDRFQPGQRYLCGLEIKTENLRKVLIQGKQRQRAAAALELGLLQPDQPVRSPFPGIPSGEETGTMDFVNKTGVQPGWTMGFERDGRELLIVAVKATFVIPESPDVEPRLAEEQVPLVKADTFTGEPGYSAPVYESDYAHRKPRCDVLLNGCAYARTGKRCSRHGFSTGWL